MWKQIVAVSTLGVRSLPQRRSTSMVIVAGTACVVAVLLSMLSVTVGMSRAYFVGGDPSRAIVRGKGVSDFAASLSRDAVATITNAPGVAKDVEGKPIAEGQLGMNLLPPPGFVQGSMGVRLFGRAGLSLNPDFRIVEGRMFRPGRQEMVVGVGAARTFGYGVGGKVTMPGGKWPIVGKFSNGGSIMESRFVADADTVLSAVRSNGFSTVLVQLVDAEAFPEFKRWLESNPSLSVEVERQSDVNARQADRSGQLFRRIAYVIGTIMGLGALFGTVKIMYSAVRARTREIGTLRALGFGGAPVAASVIAEAVVLSLAGAAIGALIAWVVFDGREIYTWGAFEFDVSPRLVAMGLAWGVAIALLGGALPAVRAARLPAVVALRAA